MTIKRKKVKYALKGGPENRKTSPSTKTVNCPSLTHLSCDRYLSFLVLTLRHYLFTNYIYTGGRSIQGGSVKIYKICHTCTVLKKSLLSYLLFLNYQYLQASSTRMLIIIRFFYHLQFEFSTLTIPEV